MLNEWMSFICVWIATGECWWWWSYCVSFIAQFSQHLAGSICSSDWVTLNIFFRLVKHLLWKLNQTQPTKIYLTFQSLSEAFVRYWYLHRMAARILHWGAQKLSAEGGLGLRRVCSPPQSTRCSRGASWASVGSGTEPSCQCIFGIFETHRSLLVERTVLLYFFR